MSYRLFPALLLMPLVLSCSQGRPAFTSLPEGREAVFTTSDFAENVPRFFKEKIGSEEIEFLVVKIDGKPAAYLNRCRKCFASGRGFSFDTPYLRCRTCNESFPIESVSSGIGSCYPIPVKGTIEEDRLRIAPSDLSSAYYQRF